MSDKSLPQSTQWRADNKQKFSDNYIAYWTNEINFVREIIGIRYRPSQNKWKVSMTRDEIYAELILHIQLMKDKFPESDGRLCRICYNPWTYQRSNPTMDQIGTGTSGSTAPRKNFERNFSMDRFDTAKGYEKGNIIFCCRKCNQAKNSSEKWMWIRLLEIDKELNEVKTD